jgi:TM2 domain-containing membrane protein YozV
MPGAAICVRCGFSLRRGGSGVNLGDNKNLVAGLCGILLGALGVHKFILGYTKEGIIMVLVTVIGGIVTCGFGAAIMGIIGLVEGIIYLTKSDAEFEQTYVTNQRGWF